MKSYSEMTTKKLTALLTSVDTEQQAEIQAVLDARQQGQTEEPAVKVQTTEEEDAFLAKLGEAEQIQDAQYKATGGLKVGKMTYEDAVAKAEELSTNVGHRCQVVPFNTIEWADGTIAGVVADKRSCKVLYAIRCDDGRRIFKAHDSKMLIVLDEIAEATKLPRGKKAGAVKSIDLDNLMALANDLSSEVGKHVLFVPTKDLFMVRESDQAIVDITELQGTIMAIVPEKRVGKILLRIQATFMAYDENGVDTDDQVATKLQTITVHKVYGSEGTTILNTYDEEVRSKYQDRIANRIVTANMTTAEKLEKIAEAYEKAAMKLQKAKDICDSLQAQYNAVKAEMETEQEAATADQADSME